MAGDCGLFNPAASPFSFQKIHQELQATLSIGFRKTKMNFFNSTGHGYLLGNATMTNTTECIREYGNPDVTGIGVCTPACRTTETDCSSDAQYTLQ
jgi:hypothetical protein